MKADKVMKVKAWEGGVGRHPRSILDVLWASDPPTFPEPLNLQVAWPSDIPEAYSMHYGRSSAHYFSSFHLGLLRGGEDLGFGGWTVVSGFAVGIHLESILAFGLHFGFFRTKHETRKRGRARVTRVRSFHSGDCAPLWAPHPLQPP